MVATIWWRQVASWEFALSCFTSWLAISICFAADVMNSDRETVSVNTALVRSSFRVPTYRPTVTPSEIFDREKESTASDARRSVSEPAFSKTALTSSSKTVARSLEVSSTIVSLSNKAETSEKTAHLPSPSVSSGSSMLTHRTSSATITSSASPISSSISTPSSQSASSGTSAPISADSSKERSLGITTSFISHIDASSSSSYSTHVSPSSQAIANTSQSPSISVSSQSAAFQSSSLPTVNSSSSYSAAISSSWWSSSVSVSFYSWSDQSTVVPVSSCAPMLPLSILCANYTAYVNSSSSDILSTWYPASSMQTKHSTAYFSVNSTMMANVSWHQSSTEMSSSYMPVISGSSVHAWTSLYHNVTSVGISSSESPVVTSFSMATLSSAYHRHTSQVPLTPSMGKCGAALVDLTHSINNMTVCAMHFLRPLTVCRNCLKPFEALQDLHKLIYLDCGKELIYAYNAKYQLIPKIYESQYSLWDTLDCEKCYMRDAGSHVEPTEAFTEFFTLYNNTLVCIQNYTYGTLKPFDILKQNVSFNVSTSQHVCRNCGHLYQKLQSKYAYYEDSMEATNTPWCADINWAVNETRHRWAHFHCDNKPKDLESIIALTCFFGFLPVIFYVGAKLHADVKDRKKTNRSSYYESD